jgi:hypothetical protein
MTLKQRAAKRFRRYPTDRTSRCRTRPEGATVHFRQTFKQADPNRVLTRVLRDSGQGWVPTSSDIDHLVMTGRSAVAS